MLLALAIAIGDSVVRMIDRVEPLFSVFTTDCLDERRTGLGRCQCQIQIAGTLAGSCSRKAQKGGIREGQMLRL